MTKPSSCGEYLMVRFSGRLRGTLMLCVSVAFSPDGSMIASGSDDRTIKLWRVSDGELLRTLEEHTGSVTSVAFSPDGSMIASGGGYDPVTEKLDNTIKLWRVSDGALLKSYDEETVEVCSPLPSPPMGV
jgi:WD40 repeat protein